MSNYDPKPHFETSPVLQLQALGQVYLGTKKNPAQGGGFDMLVLQLA